MNNKTTGRGRIRKTTAQRMRFASLSNQTYLSQALDSLWEASKAANAADCPALLKKIRSAIKSAGGAQRHMQRRLDAAKGAR